jgi:uncharacterized delta-60 repeat protein
METLRQGQKTRALMALIVGTLAALIMSAPPAFAAAAGSLDTSFGHEGYVTVALGSSVGAAAVVVQPDGKIVTAGEGDLGAGNVIVSTRMTADGQLDPTYGIGGIVTVDINGGAGVDSGAGLALQADGKIVIAGGGRHGTYGPITFAAVRLTTSGALDQSFGINGVRTVPIGTSSIAIANAVVIQPDGKIALAGTALSDHNQFAAVRLTADGALDTSFGTAGITTLSPAGGAWGMARQSDGKLILAGQADYDNPQVSGAQQFMAARLNADGTLDTTYGSGGIVNVPIGGTALGYGIVLQSDGKALLAGPAFTNTGVNATVRLTTDGTIDPSYGTAGISTIADWNGANGIILDGSGRALLPAVGASVLRLNPDGSADQTFGTAGNAVASIGTSGGANGAAVQRDGKIVLAGAANVNGKTVLTVIRFNGAATAPSSTGAATSASVKHPPATAAAAGKAPRRYAQCAGRLRAHASHKRKRSSKPKAKPKPTSHRRAPKHQRVAPKHRRVAHRLISRKGLCAGRPTVR